MKIEKSSFEGFDAYSQYDILLSLSRAFGKYNSSSNNLAIILFYLLTQWFLFLTSRNSKRFSGMIKTYEDISVATNLSERYVRKLFGQIEERGLIYRADEHSRAIIVNDNAVADFFIDGHNLLELEKDDHLNNKKLIKRRMDFTQINLCLEDFELLLDLSHDDIATANLLYLFPHYYNIYTHDVYQWNEVKFNTLIKRWKECFNKDCPEYGLSRGIKDTVNDSLTCNLHFEKLFLKHFNADVDDSYTRKDVVCDNLLIEEV